MLIYLGTFLMALATLAFEVTLTRLLSVISWYHLAFFAVSTAMLGMTAGATTVYLKREWFSPGKIDDSLGIASVLWAISVPVSLLILCMTPIELERSAVSLLGIGVATLACVAPFIFSGIAITAVLTRRNMPIGRIYASDLAGASAGCLAVLFGLERMDAPSLIILSGAVGAAAGLCFAAAGGTATTRRRSIVLLVVLVLLGIFNSSTEHGISPMFVKDRIEAPGSVLFKRWNSYSRIAVHEMRFGYPQYWGASPKASTRRVHRHYMTIDGCAGTAVTEFRNLEDIEYLKYDVTNLAYHLRPSGGACVIGVGGGRDVQSALLFGHERVLGIELNPIFVDLLQNRFGDFAGLADRKEVRLVVDEARSYLARSGEKFSLLQMSLIDTWASTGAGAYSLSENVLYTVDGWEVLFDSLSENGLFTVSRWFNPDHPGETARILSLASATLMRKGVEEPAAHIALASSGEVATLIVSRSPFGTGDVAELESVCAELEYDIHVLPGRSPEHRVFKKILSAATVEELVRNVKDEPYDYTPPTDDSPYFFNILKLGSLPLAFKQDVGVISGNVMATLTLVTLICALMFFTVVTIVVPLCVKQRLRAQGRSHDSVSWSASMYFSLIGAGFMFVEIAMIQRLSVFLGHPVYALGVLLFSLILSAGMGSLASEYIPLNRAPGSYLLPLLIAGAVAGLIHLVPVVTGGNMTAPMAEKILVSIGMLAPAGFLMGMCFPMGMRMVKETSGAETPWYWALNGIMGVLCSALAVLVSIHVSIAASLYIGGICYLLTAALMPFMLKERSKRQVGRTVL